DLGRVDVESAADVHVLEPVGDSQVAGLVDGTDVASMQPTVDVDGGSGGVRVVEVTQHHVGPAQQNLACFSWPGRIDPQLEPGERTPAGGGDRHRVVVGTAHGAHAVGLGQTVGGQHDVDVKFGLHAFHQHDRHGSRPGHREP